MLHTTFTLLKEHGACVEGYRKLAEALGGIQKYGRDTPIPLARIAETNGLYDALWCLRAVLPEDEARVKPFIRTYMADILEHLVLLKLPLESKALLIEGAKLLRNPATTDTQLEQYVQTAEAAWAAETARAARAAAEAAARAAWAAAWAARAAWAVAWAARAAAEAAENKWQIDRFITLLDEETT